MSKNFNAVENYINGQYNIVYNVINQCWYNGTEILNEHDLYRNVINAGLSIAFNDLIAILKSKLIRQVDPIKDYFNNLKPLKKGEPDYIGLLCNYIELSNGYEYNNFKENFTKHLVRTIKCAITDNYFNKHCFVFVGSKQNTGKSTLCRWLVPQQLKEYYTENISMDKDSIISLTDNFIINLDELSTFSRMEINSLKSVLSKDKVKVRKPYERKASTFNRRCSFFGSTNKNEFLTDETGSVRWICFEIDKINWEYSKKINIDNIWRSAYDLYKSNYQCEMNNADILQNENRNMRYDIVTNEYELIEKMFSAGDHFLTATDIQNEISYKYPAIKTNIVNIGKALVKLGFQKKQVFNGSYSVKGYLVNRNI